jgi:NhaA family Na+:H+ antiporter
MTIFFFVVALEIKRELVIGELRDRRVAALPVFAALGGMVGPALIYLAINAGDSGRAGWGIPMATDIAFVVGALGLLGRRVPSRLRLFLLTLAIVDDIGAIAVIAVAYSGEIAWEWLGVAIAVLSLVPVLRLLRISSVTAYLVLGIGCWLAAARSGLHPTLAGVALGLLIPARPIRARALLTELEVQLHPVSCYFIVPVFALANAGVLITEGSVRDALASRVFWGVVVGLLAGKTIGIATSSLLAARLPIAGLPRGVGLRSLVGGAALAGIGFTVSLFIVDLAFDEQRLLAQATLGVLVGSVLSGGLGASVLLPRRSRRTRSLTR